MFNGVQMDTEDLKLDAPIVLAHGLLGFSRFTFLGGKSISYFREIPEFLEATGNKVVLTGVPPTQSIASRGMALKQTILKQFGGRQVHLVAHSMGGLDARYMITHLEMDEQVLSLTTIGTPHRGTEVADLLVNKGERFGFLKLIQFLPIPIEAFYDLRSSASKTFNAQTPDSPKVRYFSVIGVKKRDEMFFPLRMTSDVLTPIEGPNDGLVSSYSARWGEFETIWDCDHANQIGWVGRREKSLGVTFNVQQGYQGILRQLKKSGF